MLEYETHKKVQIGYIANLISLGCCLALQLITVSDQLNTQIFLYVVLAIVYGVLLVFPLKRFPAYDISTFFLTVSLLVYFYMSTPNFMAVVLFYLYAVQIGLTFERKYSLAGAMVIAGIFFVASIDQIEIDKKNMIWVIMHSLLIINVNVLAQHLSQLEHQALYQNEKVKQLLSQMENSYKTVSALAEKDELTALYNYRSFRNKLEELVPHNIAILLLDVDYFKIFNDSYGHLCGDAVLRDMATVLKGSLREGDMVFRYGGEEFAVIIQCSNETEVQATAVRISNNVERHPFYFGKESALHVTVSIGYAIGKEGIETTEELFRIADEALYNAKESGRNLIGCPNGQICNPTTSHLYHVS